MASGEMFSSLRSEDFVYVCRDAGAGGYEAFPDVFRLQDGRICYCLSSDEGRTWTVSRPLGFPGHCPYLLRTPDDIILLAHRLPQTSLHYSLDEAKTWSGNVIVDDVGGAYPSMVNLRDGSVLIVYYEEGEGSDIRARRFRTTKAGIR